MGGSMCTYLYVCVMHMWAAGANGLAVACWGTHRTRSSQQGDLLKAARMRALPPSFTTSPTVPPAPPPPTLAGPDPPLLTCTPPPSGTPTANLILKI
jgi:hypothetical protein